MKKNFVSFVSRTLLVAFCFVQFLGVLSIVNPTYVSAATADTVAVSAALEGDANQYEATNWSNYAWKSTTANTTGAFAEENGYVKATFTSAVNASNDWQTFAVKPTLADGTTAISTGFLAGQKSILTYRTKVTQTVGTIAPKVYTAFMAKSEYDSITNRGSNTYIYWAVANTLNGTNESKYIPGTGANSGTLSFTPVLNMVKDKWYRYIYIYDNSDNTNKYLTTHIIDESTGALYRGERQTVTSTVALDSMCVLVQKAGTTGTATYNVYMDNVKIYRPGAADSFAVDGVSVSNSKNLVASFTDPVLPFLNNTDTICVTNDSIPNTSPASITITEKGNSANAITVNSFSSPYLEAKDWTKTQKINVKLDTALTPGTYTMTFNNFKNINGTALSTTTYDFTYTEGQSAIKLDDKELYNWRIASGHTSTNLANVSTAVSGNQLTLTGGGNAKSSTILSSPYYPGSTSGYMRDYWGNGSVISFRFKVSGATADKAKLLFGFADQSKYGVSPDAFLLADIYQVLRFDQSVTTAGKDIQYTDGAGANGAGSTTRAYDTIGSFNQSRWYKVVLKWTSATAFTMYVIDEQADVTESKDITITSNGGINFDSLVLWNLGNVSTVGQTVDIKDVNVYKTSSDVATKDTVLVKQGYGDGVPSSVSDATKEYDATKWSLTSYAATNNKTTLNASYTDDAVKIRWDGSSDATAANGSMSVGLIKNLDGTNLNSSFFANSKTVIQYTMKYIAYTPGTVKIYSAFVNEADYNSLGTATAKTPYFADVISSDTIKYNTGNTASSSVTGVYSGLSTFAQDKWYTFTYVLDQTGASRKLTTYISDGTNSYTTGEKTIGSNYSLATYPFDSFMFYLQNSETTTAFFDLYLKNFKIFKPSTIDASQYNVKSLTLRDADNNGSVLSSVPASGTNVKLVSKYVLRDDLGAPGYDWDSANSLTYAPKTILTFYDSQDRLLGVQIADITKPTNLETTTTIGSNVSVPANTAKVKAFVWTDTSSIVSISAPTVLQ